MHINVFVLFSCVVLLATKHNGVYADISCSAGEMPEGLKSEVVCNFGKDIRSPRQTFMVWKYPLNTTSFDSKLRSEVLNCAWNSDPAAQPPQVCIVGEGYSYNYNHNVISTVTVDIDDVTKDHEGIYECQLVSDHSIPSTRCALTVAKTYNLACYRKGGVLHCKADDGLIFIDTVIDKLKLEIPDASNKAGGNYMYRRVEGSTWETESSGTSHSLTIIIVIVVSIILAVIVVASIFLLYIRLRRHKRRRSGGTADNDEPAAILLVPPTSPADDTSQLQSEPALVDENSDSWTMSQVCQWVGQVEGGRFKEHVDCFRKNNVDGEALLSYKLAISLKTYLGMGCGVDGKDRSKLMEHIGQLKKAVKERQAREIGQPNHDAASG